MLHLRLTKDEKAEDLMSELTGRIVYTKGENFGYVEYDNEVTLDFYCGPECKDGCILDYSDCGVDKQLQELFSSNNLNVMVGSAESYHVAIVPVGMTPDEYWNKIVKVMKDVGVVEMNEVDS